ncbi:MAG: DUF975 family protein [Clostridia bacterium]
MSNKEIKLLAKQKVKSLEPNLFLPMFVMLVLNALLTATWLLMLIAGATAWISSIFIYKFVVTDKRDWKALLEDYKNVDNLVVVLFTYVLQFVFTCLWALLFIIPGLIKSFSYSQTRYVIKDTNYTFKYGQAIKVSREMMNGFKWKYFCLHFRFIGEILLTGLTLGIYGIWYLPRLETANVLFYIEVKKQYVEAHPNEDFCKLIAPKQENFDNGGFDIPKEFIDVDFK